MEESVTLVISEAPLRWSSSQDDAVGVWSTAVARITCWEDTGWSEWSQRTGESKFSTTALLIFVVLHLFVRSYIAVSKAKFAQNVHVLSSPD